MLFKVIIPRRMKKKYTVLSLVEFMLCVAIVYLWELWKKTLFFQSKWFQVVYFHVQSKAIFCLLLIFAQKLSQLGGCYCSWILFFKFCVMVLFRIKFVLLFSNRYNRMLFNFVLNVHYLFKFKSLSVCVPFFFSFVCLSIN